VCAIVKSGSCGEEEPGEKSSLPIRVVTQEGRSAPRPKGKSFSPAHLESVSSERREGRKEEAVKKG
jgi:hypothetical protein